MNLKSEKKFLIFFSFYPVADELKSNLLKSWKTKSFDLSINPVIE